MGAFSSRVIQLINGCYTIDGVHTRIYTLEQRVHTLERAQGPLDRKYSDIMISHDLLHQQLRGLQYELKQTNHRVDTLDQNNDMEEIVVLRS